MLYGLHVCLLDRLKWKPQSALEFIQKSEQHWQDKLRGCLSEPCFLPAYTWLESGKSLGDNIERCASPQSPTAHPSPHPWAGQVGCAIKCSEPSPVAPLSIASICLDRSQDNPQWEASIHNTSYTSIKINNSKTKPGRLNFQVQGPIFLL